MSLSADQIIAKLERRYDHLSARTIFRRVLEEAKLAEQATYSTEDITRFVEVLQAVGAEDRLGAVPQLLLDAGGPKQAPAAAQAAPQEAAPAAPAPKSAPEQASPQEAAPAAPAPAKEAQAEAQKGGGQKGDGQKGQGGGKGNHKKKR